MKSVPVVGSPFEVLFNFLPGKYRLVQREGIEIFTLFYMHDGLEDFVNDGQFHLVRYDPRNIMHIYVRGPDGAVLQCRATSPDARPISLTEWNRYRDMTRQSGEDPAEVAIKDAGILAQDVIVAESKRAQRAARRLIAKEAERQKQAAKIHPTTDEVSASDLEADLDDVIPDYSVDLISKTQQH